MIEGNVPKTQNTNKKYVQEEFLAIRELFYNTTNTVQVLVLLLP